MLTLAGNGMTSIVVDGGWVEKLQGSTSVMRAPIERFRGFEVSEVSRRTKFLRGPKEARLLVTIDVGTFMTLDVRADQRDEVDRLRAALEAGGA